MSIHRSGHRSFRGAVAAGGATALAVGGLAAGPLTAPAGAVADPPTAEPRVLLSATAELAVGHPISGSSLVDDSVRNNFTQVPMRLRWRSDRPQDVCSYDVRRYSLSGPPAYVAQRQPSIAPTERSFLQADYNGRYGGSGELVGWRVTAHRCGGGATHGYTSFARPVVFQEGGASPATHVRAVTARSAQTRIRSTRDASGGALVSLDARGAEWSARLTTLDGERVGLVMPTGPDRGLADVIIDGERVATVNTRSPVPRNRVITFQRALPGGEHEIRVRRSMVRNLGVVEVDALVRVRVAGPVSDAAGRRAPAIPRGELPVDRGKLSSATAAIVPQSGRLVGAAASPRDGGDDREAATRVLEGSLGYFLDVHRTYFDWEAVFPNRMVTADLERGRVPAISIFPNHRWAAIAAGQHDEAIRRHARQLRDLRTPIVLSFHHEPEDDPDFGTPAEFAAAWRQYVRVFRAEGADNVSFAWILMAWSFSNKAAVASAYYPGDAWVDWLGVDAYNWYDCHEGASWTALERVLADFRAFAAERSGKPVFVAEYGSRDDLNDLAAKGSWIRDTNRYFASWPALKAVAYYHSALICSWFLDSTPPGLTAYRQLGQELSHQFQRPTAAPRVRGSAAYDVTARSAWIDGTVDPGSDTASVSVVYGPKGGWQAVVPLGAVPAGAGPTTRSVRLTGLKAASEYTYRIRVVSHIGEHEGWLRDLGTRALPGISRTRQTYVTADSATIEAAIHTRGLQASWRLLYGPTPDYGRGTPSEQIWSTSDKPVSTWLTGLSPDTEYHARVAVTTVDGETRGYDIVFRTKRAS